MPPTDNLTLDTGALISIATFIFYLGVYWLTTKNNTKNNEENGKKIDELGNKVADVATRVTDKLTEIQIQQAKTDTNVANICNQNDKIEHDLRGIRSHQEILSKLIAADQERIIELERDRHMERERRIM
jgi:septal ring factor EnvC (AmiA/AmiB activator)